MSNLEKYLKKPVSELIKREGNSFSNADIERHQMYSHLLFSITAFYFNGSKYGNEHSYPLNPTDLNTDSYFGHNIAAIAVSKNGEVLDFEFNHNKIFNSSVEHAESRLIRRMFSLSQVYNSWTEEEEARKKYGNLLSEVTVYTTLESCTQCTGIMTLGDVKNVVYLQEDPGMYHIGNIVKNLTDGQGYIEAPLPISGKEIDFNSFEKLNKAFAKFEKQQESEKGDAFVIFEDGKKRYTGSITSFLCTSEVYNIFNKSSEKLEKFDVEHDDYKPHDDALTNNEVLGECLNFFEYATKKGGRGTPHRM